MLDTGVQLENERAEQIARIRNVGPEAWQPSDLAFLKDATTAEVSGIPLKLAYGSDYPYRDPGIDWRLACNGVDARPSFAKGGLSTVWGAALLPYRDEDMRDWPIGSSQLADHYRAVLEFMPMSGRSDLLEQAFPLYSKRPQNLKLSNQAADFLRDIGESAQECERAGLLYGASRLAVRAPSQESAGCCYCGQCMYGCPYGMIYSSAETVEVLLRNPHFSYQGNVAVDRVTERGDTVTLLAHDLRTREQLRLDAARVFLACGCLATTKILLDSLEAYDRAVTLRDSCYFLLPLIRHRATANATHERLHTLAQMFLEIIDPQVCDQTAHLQVYTYNELYSTVLKKMFGPLFGVFDMPARMVLNRLLLVQGYLPSKYSPSIQLLLRKEPGSKISTLHASAVENERTKPMLRSVSRKLWRSRKLLRATPVSPLLRVGKPGRSYHSGGSFPMRANPKEFESDELGRPHGFQRVHAVDATVLTDIPATTITFSVMANAHRIGSGAAEC
jgi:ferredoxin